MPPDNRSPKSWLWPAGKEPDFLWLTRTKRVVPLLFLNCQPQPWDLRVEDETVTLTTRSKGLKHDKCDYNIEESRLGRQGKRQSQQDTQLFITSGRAGTFKAKQLTAASRKMYSPIPLQQFHCLHLQLNNRMQMLYHPNPLHLKPGCLKSTCHVTDRPPRRVNWSIKMKLWCRPNRKPVNSDQ